MEFQNKAKQIHSLTSNIYFLKLTPKQGNTKTLLGAQAYKAPQSSHLSCLPWEVYFQLLWVVALSFPLSSLSYGRAGIYTHWDIQISTQP